MKRLIVLVAFLVCSVPAFAEDSMSMLNQQNSGPFVVQSAGGENNTFLIFDTQTKDVWLCSVLANGAEKWAHRNLSKE